MYTFHQYYNVFITPRVMLTIPTTTHSNVKVTKFTRKKFPSNQDTNLTITNLYCFSFPHNLSSFIDETFIDLSTDFSSFINDTFIDLSQSSPEIVTVQNGSSVLLKCTVINRNDDPVYWLLKGQHNDRVRSKCMKYSSVCPHPLVLA